MPVLIILIVIAISGVWLLLAPSFNKIGKIPDKIKIRIVGEEKNEKMD